MHHEWLEWTYNVAVFAGVLAYTWRGFYRPSPDGHTHGGR